MAQENEHGPAGTPAPGSLEEPELDGAEIPVRPAWRAIFLQAFDKARRQQRIDNRRDLGRDRSRSLFLLAGAAFAVLLLFLGLFSSSNTARRTANEKPPGAPDLGRRATPGQQDMGQTGSVTPLLSAQTAQQAPQNSQDVTPEDVGRTARPTQPLLESRLKPAPAAPAGSAGPYALGRIDFSDPAIRQPASGSSIPQPQAGSDDLRKPSLVFVRSMRDMAVKAGPALAAVEESSTILDLPAGTRLVARLESVATSAIKAPVIAAIEYNYERNGAVVVPAGAKAVGSLQQADRSGSVAIRFDSLQLPDGRTLKIDASAMSLTYGALKGNVSGKKTGTRFLVRTFTGLGTVATYLVGAGSHNGFDGPLSESALLRDRVATNMGIAGDQELNNLAFNQNIVVTVPGNTRFYVVIEKSVPVPDGETRPAVGQLASNSPLPTAVELRQLMQLRRELSEMYQQAGSQSSATQAPPQ